MVTRMQQLRAVPVRLASILVTLLATQPTEARALSDNPVTQPPAETAIPSDYAIAPIQLYELGFVTLIGLAALILQGVLLNRTKTHQVEGMRLMLVTLIVTLSVGMLIVGFSERQITPVIGLFGSAIGYLLGRSERSSQAEGNPEGG